jgi:hypothetical protein
VIGPHTSEFPHDKVALGNAEHSMRAAVQVRCGEGRFLKLLVIRAKKLLQIGRKRPTPGHRKDGALQRHVFVDNGAAACGYLVQLVSLHGRTLQHTVHAFTVRTDRAEVASEGCERR